MCICKAESLCCPPETITTLLIVYTPIIKTLQLEKKQRNRPYNAGDVGSTLGWKRRSHAPPGKLATSLNHEPACYHERPHVSQLRPDTAKQINIKKKQCWTVFSLQDHGRPHS